MSWRTVAFAVLLGAGLPAVARAQDGPQPAGDPPPSPPSPAPEEGDVVDTRVDVKGSRFKITMKTGREVTGVLPRGVFWEKQDATGEFVPAKKDETGAGLRVQYVMSMDGEVFVLSRDIKETKDLGALTDEQKSAIRERVIADRRRVIEERERKLQEVLERMRPKGEEAGKEKGAEGTGTEAEDSPEAKKRREDEKKGDELLAKFPPPKWHEEKVNELKQRAVVNGIFPNDDERQFMNNIDLWKAAFDRMKAREAKEKAAKERAEKEKAAKEAAAEAKK